MIARSTPLEGCKRAIQKAGTPCSVRTLPRTLFCAAALLILAVPVHAAEWFVAPGGNGSGTGAAPFGRIQDGLDAAQPGDVVTVRAGTYAGPFTTVRAGSAGQPIRLRADGARGSVVVSSSGRVATINHAFFIIENLVLDGQYGTNDAVRAGSAAHNLIIRATEVRRSSRDLIDLGSVNNVLIDGSLIHHALNAEAGRTDAHGIAAGAVQNLTIRDTDIHTFSGDGLQVDPGRASPGWDMVTLENVRIWLAPLAAPENGFPAGTVTGENAIDTKANAAYRRARLTVRNTTAWGFRNGLIGNMAAFNLKEHIDATLDGITVHDSEIAFRLRGAGSATTGAWVRIQNAVVYRVDTAYRYEDDIRNLRIWNNTLGAAVTRPFRAASSSATGLDVRNLLIVGAKPPEAAHASNLSVAAAAFRNVALDDYRLTPGAPPIDRGVSLPDVTADRSGIARPQGSAYDVGAYEWAPGSG